MDIGCFTAVWRLRASALGLVEASKTGGNQLKWLVMFINLEILAIQMADVIGYKPSIIIIGLGYICIYKYRISPL